MPTKRVEVRLEMIPWLSPDGKAVAGCSATEDTEGINIDLHLAMTQWPTQVPSAPRVGVDAFSYAELNGFSVTFYQDKGLGQTCTDDT